MLVSRRHLALVLGVLLLALALRVMRLQERPLWYDEAFSVFLAEQDWTAIVRGTAADIQPPLYYVVLHVWQFLGEQVYTMRFLSVGLSLLTVALMYQLTRVLTSPRAALLAAFIAAIMPFQIYYAQELRMYALLEFALLLYLYAFVRILRGAQGRVWVLVLAVSGAAGLYSQSLAVLSWVIPDVYALFRRGRWLNRVLIGQSVSLVLFLPWLAVLTGQLAVIQHSYWTTPPGLAEVFQLLLAFTVNQPLPDWFLPAALFVTLALDTMLALELSRTIRRGMPPGLGVLPVALVAPALLMFVFSYAVRSIFVVRALIVSSAAFASLVGWLLARVDSAMARRSLTALAVALVTVALAFQLPYSAFPRPPFPAADTYLQANLQAQDAIVHDNKLTFFPMHYYNRALSQVWLPDPAGAGSDTLSSATMEQLGIFPSTPEDAIASKSRVWFVIFQRAIDEAESAGRPQANKAWLDANFSQVSLKRFNDLNVYLYQR